MSFGLFFYSRFERVRDAVARIERSGGSVGYFDNGGDWNSCESWLRSKLPQCYFDDVQSVHFLSRSREKIPNLLPFFEMRKLENLNLAYALLSDQDLTHVSRLNSLKRLFLDNTNLSDKGLSQLASSESLESLYLTSTELNDNGVIPLSRLESLQDLSLAKTKISDAGLYHLSKLKKLEGLDLKQTQVSAKGIDELKVAIPNCLIFF